MDNLTLHSQGLLSKWGFGDGDMPDAVWEALGDEVAGQADWHAALRYLVRHHLLPILEQDVTVYDIDTNHNPIRASSVDGVEVDDTALDTSVTLTPEYVEVSWTDVQRAIEQTR